MSAELRAQLQAARAGDVRALSRAVSVVESGGRAARKLADLLPAGGQAWVLGLTGSPGVGKSTTTSALVALLRAQGQRVAVLAVDPSSPFSGGALLGDRVRMSSHALDPGVFIRSMASRGHLGGLSAAVPAAVRLLDAVGFDAVLLETVGVGQSEVEVAGAADTTLVLVAPGMGDAIQAAKAGILEVGDVFCVNKADRPDADATARELRSALALGTGRPAHALEQPGAEARDGQPAPGRSAAEQAAPELWHPPVLRAVASTGQGVPELLAVLQQHLAYLERTGERVARRRDRAAAEIEALVLAAVRARLRAPAVGGSALVRAARAVALGERDPWSAAAELLA